MTGPRFKACGSKLCLLWWLITLVGPCAHSICLAQNISPQRIISLGPSITEEIYLLGAGNRLVGVTTYCQTPSSKDPKEKVGSVTEINVEKILSLKPDLVLATSLANRERIEKLKKLGMKVVSFGYARDFSEICEQFLEKGRLIGVEKRAEDIVRKARTRVESTAKKVKGLPRPKVFIQLGTKPLFTANKKSFLNDYVKLAGGINIAEDAKTGLYSREKVIRKNPHHIIIASMGLAGEDEKKVWRKFKALRAAKNNEIHILDAHELCSPTPPSFADSLEDIAEILHHGAAGK